MIRRLDAKTLTKVYEQSMQEAFPPEELKPLKNMLEMQAEGFYDVWGYYPNGELVAYACVCSHQTPVLLDYYAVVESYRGQGHGSAFLQALAADRERYGSMMMEVEAVASALDEDDCVKRARRLAFYERLGFRLTVTEASVFGVHYQVLDNQDGETPHSVEEAMSSVYHYFIDNPARYEQFIKIWDLAE